MLDPHHDYKLSISHRRRPAPDLPDVDFGNWFLSPWPDPTGAPQSATLHPEHAPWRDLFAELDEVGAGLTSDAVDPLDEADAIVAACWRFGSYFHLLTIGEYYPPFRKTPYLSRLTDGEMHRINLEFSSGLASWWETRATDPERANRRVRAALELLPLDWRQKRSTFQRDVVAAAPDYLAGQLKTAAAEFPPELTSAPPGFRGEANYAVNRCYRMGPIEDFHGGKSSHGTAVPGFCRFYPDEVVRIALNCTKQLAFYLIAREQIGQDRIRAEVGQDLFYPRDWSHSEETREVVFPVTTDPAPHGNPLRERFAWLYEEYYGAFWFAQEHPGCVEPGAYGVVWDSNSKRPGHYDDEADEPDTAVVYYGTPFGHGTKVRYVPYGDLKPADRDQCIQFEMEHLAEIPPELRDRLDIHPNTPGPDDNEN
jgi:hypothetical protein